jgi:TetR/AcrR family transcriptional repressor of nem operon
MTLSFIKHLEHQLRDSPPKQKGERTRLRLKIATAKVLERDGYHAMRVADISTTANLAEGSFYVYFSDKTDAALTVLRELLEDFITLGIVPSGERGPFAGIQAANRRWIAVCRANAGLMRCILQLGDEDKKLAHLAQRINRTWFERIAQSSAKRRGSTRGAPASLLAAYFLGGLMDELVRKLIIYPDPGLRELLTELNADDDAVADAASIVWLRVFHPDARAPKDLACAAMSFAEWIGLAPTRATPIKGNMTIASRQMSALLPRRSKAV